MIAVVILAGGEGRRIGGDKPQRLLGGVSLLDHALALARSWSPLIGVSVRPGNLTRRSKGARVLFDRGGSGPIAGIASALSFARAEGVDRVLTIPCDTPLLPPDLVGRLNAALEPSAGAAIAASGGHLHPSCALWRVEAEAALPAYLASGRASLLGFAKALDAAVVEWPIETFDPFFNINNESDLAAAEVLIKGR